MFESRIQKLKKISKEQKIDAVFISSAAHITYLTGYANFSEIEREAYLIIGKNFQYIITDGRYSEAVKKQVNTFKLFERGHKNKTENLFKKLKNKINFLGIEENNLTVSEHKLIKKFFKTKHFEIGSIRSIKTNEEIKKIEKACKIGDLTFDFILKKIKLGLTEKQVAYELEKFIKQQGAEFSFPPIVAFGENSSVPHHQTGNTKLEKRGQFVLLDFGVKFDHYCSDMTRTIFFGSPYKKQKDIYEIVLSAQQKAADFINSAVKSGKKILVNEVDQIAREYIIKKGYPTIPHSLGHGIGLEVHEHPHLSPKSKELLKEGMVFSIEPGIYIPGFGGVRIEDLYILEKDKLRQLTTSKKTLITV